MIRSIMAIAVLPMLAMSGIGYAQEKDTTIDDAKDVVTQPARDVGIEKEEVPPVLIAAAQAPYGRDGVRTCAQLTGAIRALTAELGPDYGDGSERKASVLKRGGSIAVNSFIPFRSLIREASGAASADREMAAAQRAGVARRGFLRGLYTQRGCRTGM